MEGAEGKSQDEILVRLCQNGDKRAFEQLVIRYQDKIFSVIYRFVKDRDTVNDLAQDVFIKAFNSLKGFEGRSSFYTWLYQIAVYTALNHLSLARVRTTRNLEVEEIERGLPDPNAGIGNLLENGYIHGELAQAALSAIEELPEEYKKVFILKEYEEMSYEEIAETLNIPIGTVRSRLNRARTELRRVLKVEFK